MAESLSDAEKSEFNTFLQEVNKNKRRKVT